MVVTPERHRAYELTRYHRRKAKMSEYLGGECAYCGASSDLQIDHIDPDLKLFNVGANWSLSWGKLVEELNKCQLLCKPCHKVKSDSEQGVEHGGGAYGKRYCRCEPCRQRKREYMKRYLRVR